jgi:hypothetical protein
MPTPRFGGHGERVQPSSTIFVHSDSSHGAGRRRVSYASRRSFASVDSNPVDAAFSLRNLRGEARSHRFVGTEAKIFGLCVSGDAPTCVLRMAGARARRGWLALGNLLVAGRDQ